MREDKGGRMKFQSFSILVILLAIAFPVNASDWGNFWKNMTEENKRGFIVGVIFEIDTVCNHKDTVEVKRKKLFSATCKSINLILEKGPEHICENIDLIYRDTSYRKIHPNYIFRVVIATLSGLISQEDMYYVINRWAEKKESDIEKKNKKQRIENYNKTVIDLLN